MVSNGMMSLLPSAADDLAARVQAPGPHRPATHPLEHLGAALAAFKGSSSNARASAGYATVGSAAVVPLAGLMSKSGDLAPSFIQQCSTVRTAAAISAAVADPKVSSVLLWIESPGGAIAGVGELPDAIRGADNDKPVVGYIDDLGASAAYYAACGCRSIYANASATIGAIGVYSAVYDTSAALGSAGVKAVVVRSGALKGIGTPGDPVTDPMRAALQKNVDAFAELFIAAVARGRRVSIAKAREWADGRVEIGDSAKRCGMIDGIATLEAVLASMVGKPAPGVSSGVSSGVSACASAVPPPSVAPVVPPAAAESRGSAVDRWNAIVEREKRALVARGVSDYVAKRRATATVADACPGLHAEYLAEFNARQTVNGGSR